MLLFGRGLTLRVRPNWFVCVFSGRGHQVMTEPPRSLLGSTEPAICIASGTSVTHQLWDDLARANVALFEPTCVYRNTADLSGCDPTIHCARLVAG